MWTGNDVSSSYKLCIQTKATISISRAVQLRAANAFDRVCIDSALTRPKETYSIGGERVVLFLTDDALRMRYVYILPTRSLFDLVEEFLILSIQQLCYACARQSAQRPIHFPAASLK